MRWHIIILFAICLMESYAQSNLLDSLTQENTITTELLRSDSIWFDSTQAQMNHYLDSGLNDKFEQALVEFMRKSRGLGRIKLIAEGDYLNGKFFSNISKFDSSYFYFYRSVGQYEQINDSLNVARCLINMSILRVNVGSYYEAMKISSRALEYLNKSPENKELLISAYNNIGISAEELDQTDKALEYYSKSIDLSSRSIEKLVLLNNIGMVYQKLGEYDSALVQFRKALNYKNEAKYPEYYFMILDNIYFTEFLGGNLNIGESLYDVNDARDSIGNLMGKIVSLLHLAYFEQSSGNIDQANTHATRSLDLARSIGDKKNSLKALTFLAVESGNLNYIEDYIQFNDSVIKEERSLDHKFALIDYETEERIKENNKLKLLSASRALALYESEKRNRRMLMFSVLLMIIIILFAGYVKFKRRLNKKDRLIEKLKVREEERSKLSFHLHEDIASDLLIGLQRGELMNENKANIELVSIMSFIERAYDKMRRISQDLSVVGFDKISFVKRMTFLVKEFSFDSNRVITHYGLGDVNWVAIESEIKREILSVIKESLVNMMKHSSASMASIYFSFEDNILDIKIKDNGVGMDDNRGIGIGISNIKKRVIGIGGTLRISSDHLQGVELHIKIRT